MLAKLIFRQAEKVKRVASLKNQQRRRYCSAAANTRAVSAGKIGKSSKNSGKKKQQHKRCYSAAANIKAAGTNKMGKGSKNNSKKN